jgi:ribosome-associated translation inhibitor RaiA
MRKVQEVRMRTEVSILHDGYPASARELVDGKLQDLFRFCSDKVSMSARLDRVKDIHRIEIVANVPHGPVLVVGANADRYRDALDEALSRMTRLLKKSREKRTIERRRGIRAEV